MLQISVLWMGAVAISQLDAGDGRDNAQLSDWCAALLWAGNFLWFVRNAQRPFMKLWLRGPHLSLEQSAVPQNFGFVAHRNNEVRTTSRAGYGCGHRILDGP